jgi:hypothetical protein
MSEQDRREVLREAGRIILTEPFDGRPIAERYPMCERHQREHEQQQAELKARRDSPSASINFVFDGLFGDRKKGDST